MAEERKTNDKPSMPTVFPPAPSSVSHWVTPGCGSGQIMLHRSPESEALEFPGQQIFTFVFVVAYRGIFFFKL